MKLKNPNGTVPYGTILFSQSPKVLCQKINLKNGKLKNNYKYLYNEYTAKSIVRSFTCLQNTRIIRLNKYSTPLLTIFAYYTIVRN